MERTRAQSEFVMQWLQWIDRNVAAGLVLLIRGYQLTLSPWLGRSCRFTPTCSQYGIDALKTHGTLSGVWLTGRRLFAPPVVCRRPTPCRHQNHNTLTEIETTSWISLATPSSLPVFYWA